MSSRAARSVASLAELAANTARFVDLGVRLVLGEVENKRWVVERDEELCRIGGRWDRRSKCWSGEATSYITLRLHRGQAESARWLADWLSRFVTDNWDGIERDWTAMLVGGRRSGKSHLAVMFLVAFAIASPSAVVLAVSPTREHGTELDRVFLETLPRSWYRRFAGTSGRSITYKLTNGATIALRSAAKAKQGGLKLGKVDLTLINEGQLQAQTAHTALRAAAADAGGLCLVAANPADSERGQWVEDLFLGARENTVDAIGFQLDPRENPFIEYAALESLAREVDQRTFEREVLGHFVPIGDVVMHAWTADNVRPPREGLVDITPIITRRELGHAAAFVLGFDFQRTPHCTAAALKVFRDPAQPDEELAFVVDEWSGKDEHELLDVIESTAQWRPGARDEAVTYRGWRLQDENREVPTHALGVLDSSAWWQDSEHAKGQSSDRIFAARGWRHLFRPNPKSDRNPDVKVRVKLANARLCSAAGVRRFFVAPWCKTTIQAFRTYPNIHGEPDRRHKMAHWIDSATYPAFALWSRVRVNPIVTPQYQPIGKFNRGQMFPR